MKLPNFKNIIKYLPQARKPQKNIFSMVGFFVIFAMIIGLFVVIKQESLNIKIGGFSRGGEYEQLAKTHPRGEEFLGHVNKGYDNLGKEDFSDNQQAYLDIAFYKNELGDTEGSIDAYLEGLKHYPNAELFLSNLAHVYENTKQYDDAEIYYKKVITLNPNNVRIIGDLANLYRFYMPEKENEILPLVEVFGLANNPNDSNLLIYLAQYYRFALKNRDKAVEYYHKVIEVNPSSAASVQVELKNLLSQPQ